MNLLKSPIILRFVEKTYGDLINAHAEKLNQERINSMLDDLLSQRADNAIKRNGITHRADEYSKLILEDSRLERDINLLRKVLKK